MNPPVGDEIALMLLYPLWNEDGCFAAYVPTTSCISLMSCMAVGLGFHLSPDNTLSYPLFLAKTFL